MYSVDRDGIKVVEVSIAGTVVRQRWLAQPRGCDIPKVKPVHRCMCLMKHPIGEDSGSRRPSEDDKVKSMK